MNEMFGGTIDDVEITAVALRLRCVREFYHADGLLADDVWLWTITGPTHAGVARELLGKTVCAFEADDRTLRVWLDEGDDCVTIAGTAVSRKEEPRSRADLERVIDVLSKRKQRDEREYLALTKKVQEVTTSIHQRIDRLQRRAAFEKQRMGQPAPSFAREIEDLEGVLRRLRNDTEPSEQLSATDSPNSL